MAAGQQAPATHLHDQTTGQEGRHPRRHHLHLHPRPSRPRHAHVPPHRERPQGLRQMRRQNPGNTKKPRCTRTVTDGALRIQARSGTNNLRFEGRLSRLAKLKPRSYIVAHHRHQHGGQEVGREDAALHHPRELSGAQAQFHAYRRFAVELAPDADQRRPDREDGIAVRLLGFDHARAAAPRRSPEARTRRSGGPRRRRSRRSPGPSAGLPRLARTRELAHTFGGLSATATTAAEGARPGGAAGLRRDGRTWPPPARLRAPRAVPREARHRAVQRERERDRAASSSASASGSGSLIRAGSAPTAPPPPVAGRRSARRRA